MDVGVNWRLKWWLGMVFAVGGKARDGMWTKVGESV